MEVMEPGVGWENIHKTEDVSDRLFMQDKYTQSYLRPVWTHKGMLGQGRRVSKEVKNSHLVVFQRTCVTPAKIQVKWDARRKVWDCVPASFLLMAMFTTVKYVPLSVAL